MTTHLFLSPHLDDVVLSCGATIFTFAQHKKEKPVIMTVMAGDPPDPLPDTPLVRELHERWQVRESPVSARREEDKDAAAILGADFKHLDIPDCVYRTADGVALYPYGDEDIFGDVHPADPAISVLKHTELPYPLRDIVFYVPLGTGHHVDHQLVQHWILNMLNSHPEIKPNVLFYEDYPYARDTEALKVAADALPYRCTIVSSPVTEKVFEVKCQAAACYQSQISTFWHDKQQMRDEIRQFMLRDGQLTERFWCIVEEK